MIGGLLLENIVFNVLASVHRYGIQFLYSQALIVLGGDHSLWLACEQFDTFG